MSLKIWLPLDGSLNEKIGGRSFTKKGSALSYYDGKIGKTVFFGGGSDQLIHQLSSDDINTINSLSEFTIACWVRLETNQAGWGQILTFGDEGTSWNNIRIGFDNQPKNEADGSTPRTHFSVSNGSSNTSYQCYSDSSLEDWEWHHLIGTFKNGQLTMYVDGVAQQNTGTATFSPTLATTSYVMVGGNSSEKPRCYLNDVRFYDHCLSPREIKLLAQGLVVHYKLETYTPNLLINANQYTYSTPLIKTSSSKDGYSTTDMYCQVVPGETYYFSCETDGQWYEHNTSGVDPSNKYATLWFYLTRTYDPSNTGYDNPICLTKAMGDGRWIYTIPEGYNGLRVRTNTYSNGTDAVTIKFWNFHLNKGNAIVPMSQQEIDCSGYGNHGTRSADFNPDFSSPRYKNCAIFENNKYIKCPTRSYGGMKNTYTFSYWAKHGTGTSMDGKMVWGFHDGGALDVYPSGGYLTWNTGDGGTNLFKNNGTSIPYPTDGLWHHYVITGNGSRTLLYIDGNYKGQAITYKPIPDSGTLFLSGWNANEDYYRWNGGQISDFRLYATALSAVAVKELYQSSISLLDNGTLQCSEIVESPTNLKFKENGIVQVNSINEVIKLSEIKTKTLSDGSLWGRIFYHKNNGGKTLFTSAAEVLHTTSTDKFSRLDWLPYFKGNHAKYEFLLTYPSLVDGTNLSNQYNRWKQTYAPQDNWLGNGDGSRNANGYEAIHIDWSGQFWGGLVRQNGVSTDVTSCYIDGSSYHTNWFYAIGASTSWGGGIPGPHESIGVTETELWVRLDTNIKLFNQAISVQQIYEL